MAVASLVLGILSIIGALCLPIFGVIFGVIGLPLGIFDKSNSGIRKAGIVTNIIGIVFAIIWIALVFTFDITFEL